ncbi:MAG: nucleotide exchange factor GrpE [Actinomycetota bacterium]|nr:nucleotide exchange factor GrpE [Actinomycetota bacterium]
MEEPRKPRIVDKRRNARTAPEPGTAAPADDVEAVEVIDEGRNGDTGEVVTDVESSPLEATEEEMNTTAEPDNYLDDLRRLQADFENYRKRMMREQSALADRASARVIERMLPILDNFEAAIAHGEGGPGVEMVYKELRRALEEEGLKEIEALSEAFDPRVHEAFEAHEDDAVTEPTVASVMRRGYHLGDRVLRPAMVSVARPPEVASADAGENAAEA